jgi:plasmid stabilization system protein ParE
MALVVLWTETALADLRSLVEYIAADHPPAARKMGERLIAAVENLVEYPRRARVVPEYSRESLREVIVAPYRIVVLLDDAAQTLTVVRIWHAARGRPDLNAPD